VFDTAAITGERLLGGGAQGNEWILVGFSNLVALLSFDWIVGVVTQYLQNVV
jgi:hypothetical protein